jgi:hypothetical protein
VTDIVFTPFDKQREFLKSDKRIKAAFASKRSGKSNVAAIQGVLYQEQKNNYNSLSRDPFVGLIICPTYDMLRRLAMKLFVQYAEPFIKQYNRSTQEVTWHDGSLVYGLSAEKVSRLEGIKAHWAWVDESLQVNEDVYLEVLARTADTKGNIILTGSLGVQLINPKMHWCYQTFKQKENTDVELFEWRTSDNPYFPKEEIERLKETLDPQSYRAMFEMCWDTTPKAAVYYDFTDDNILTNYSYNPELETYVSIDWGISHKTAVLFLQYDRTTDTVFVFDEICASRKPLDYYLKQILARTYRITGYSCDISGNQDQLQTGRSNLDFFRQHNIHFKARTSGVLYGVSLVRSYILDSKGRRRLYVSDMCKTTLDELKNYRFQERNGMITNENPIKENDDALDALRYFFVNYLDKRRTEPKLTVQRMR